MIGADLQPAFGEQCPRGRDRIARFRDGAADDNVIRAAPERLRGGERPLLILQAVGGGANTRRDQVHRLGNLLADQFDFMR
jgi:hypothetical protein